MATWPASLPAVSEFVLSPVDQRAAGNVPGLKRFRDRAGAGAQAPGKARVRWVMTAAEVDTFEAFLADDIARGAAWFYMVLPTTPDSGDITAPCYSVCRFATPPSEPLLSGTTFNVTAEIDIRDRFECALAPPWSILRTASWKYTTSNPGVGWQALGFDDSGWSTGDAPIGDNSGITYVSGWPAGSTTVIAAVPALWMRHSTDHPYAGTVHADVVTDDNGPSLWVNGSSITLGSVALWHADADVAVVAGPAVWALYVPNIGSSIYGALEAFYA